MSIKYLLDGYNVIPQMPGANLARLEERRWHLIRFIERARPQGSAQNSVTVVFDGTLDAYGTMASPSVRVVFSSGESADETIKKLVAQDKNPKSIIVVTDDRDVRYAVRALGAKTSSVADFLRQGRRKGHERSSREGREEAPKHISKCDEAEITSEMREIWLKGGKGGKR